MSPPCREGLKANRTQGITLKELEKSGTPSQPSYELSLWTLRAFLFAPLQNDGKVIRKGKKDKHGCAIQAWNKDDSRQTKRSLPAVLKNQKCHEGDEHRTSIHTLCQHELQSIRWMLLPLANACAATGHCRGQKYLNGARNQLGKGIGENPVKGY